MSPILTCHEFGIFALPVVLVLAEPRALIVSQDRKHTKWVALCPSTPRHITSLDLEKRTVSWSGSINLIIRIDIGAAMSKWF